MMLATSRRRYSRSSGVFGTTLQALSPLPRAGDRLRRRARHRLGHRRPLLPGAQAADDCRRAPTMRCCICEHTFEPEDMALCPGLRRTDLLAVLLARDARCHDCCKPEARLATRSARWIGRILPPSVVKALNTDIGQYLGVLLLFAAIIGAVLAVVYFQVVARVDVLERACSSRRCGRCSSFSRSSPASRRGCSCWRMKAAASPRRKPSARPSC